MKEFWKKLLTKYAPTKFIPTKYIPIKNILKNVKFKQKILPSFCFLAAAFLLGRNIAEAVQENRMQKVGEVRQAVVLQEDSRQASGKSGVTGDDLSAENVGKSGGQEDAVQTMAALSVADVQTWGLLFTENWGLGFGESGKCPTGNATPDELKKYSAYYVGNTEEKRIYLTFDCGYENGNTEAILDALKKHNVSATFFVVGHYLESAPELVKRMAAEGHTVGNHTYHHPDMSKISDAAAFQKEMEDVRAKYKEVTGGEMAMYYRPPQGKYSIENLQMAKDLGYSTFFWSLAYVDWNVEKQPTHKEAFDKLTKRVHPGAVVLLHNTSKTNGEILDELLTKWEAMGYSFGTLEEVVE